MHPCKLTSVLLGYSRRENRGEVEDTEFLELYTEEKVCENSRDQLIKKEVEFSGVFMKNSCGV